MVSSCHRSSCPQCPRTWAARCSCLSPSPPHSSSWTMEVLIEFSCPSSKTPTIVHFNKWFWFELKRLLIMLIKYIIFCLNYKVISYCLLRDEWPPIYFSQVFCRVNTQVRDTHGISRQGEGTWRLLAQLLASFLYVCRVDKALNFQDLQKYDPQIHLTFRMPSTTIPGKCCLATMPMELATKKYPHS